jgi:hypothetical protein
MTILVAVIIFGNTSQQERCAEHTALRPKGPCCAAQQIRLLNVRFGSGVTDLRYPRHVRFYPDSDRIVALRLVTRPATSEQSAFRCTSKSQTPFLA